MISLLSIPSSVYAEKNYPPKIFSEGDLYVESQFPTKVDFTVTAIDDLQGEIPVQCNKISGSEFKIGKTLVRCMATDSQENTGFSSFVVTVGYNIVQIPDWVKKMTGFWVEEKISDSEYLTNLEYLLENKIIHVPHTSDPKTQSLQEMPVWIKNNGEKWISGNLSDDEFSIGILWLIDNGLVHL